MRMVSLPRLEKCVQLRLAAGQQPTEEMQVLAGLNRIRCVFIYPDSGDIVLAGPAGDWTAGPEGAIVNAENGRPVLRLDDLVVVFRQMMSGPDAKFGCRITPREENLVRLQEFLQRTQGRSINSEFRRAWLDQLRRKVGQAGHRGLRPRSAHPGRTGHRRGRLSHETRRHGPGSGRPRRGQLSENGQGRSRPSSAADDRASAGGSR